MATALKAGRKWALLTTGLLKQIMHPSIEQRRWLNVKLSREGFFCCRLSLDFDSPAVWTLVSTTDTISETESFAL